MGYKWLENPNAMGGVRAAEAYGANEGPGKAAKWALKGLDALRSGNYDTDATVSNYFAPMRDAFATGIRESNRAYGMGGLGLAGGSQPALMARLKQLNEQKLMEQQGLAYGQAIPQLTSALSNTYQQGIDSQRQSQLQAMGLGMQGRLGSGQYVQTPGFLDKLGKVVGIASGIGGMAMGLGGLGGLSGMGGGLPAGLSGGIGAIPSGYFRP